MLACLLLVACRLFDWTLNWTPVITHECLLPMPWLKCQLCNYGHCVSHISFQSPEPKPSFKNTSCKSRSKFNLHHVHHHLHNHVYDLYHHPSTISPICRHGFITLERILCHKKEAIPWIRMCTY